MTVEPPPGVRAAFGAHGATRALNGGRGGAWRAGDLVFKRLDMTLTALEWQADVIGSLTPDGFRTPRPHRTQDGLLVVDGWCAWEYLEGRHEPRRWTSIIEVGQRFHAAIADVARPAILDLREDSWAIADRVAWGELPIVDYLYVKHLDTLAGALLPIDAPCQLVHGDLTGNVLFSPGLPPAIIDFSPYWRPTSFASAIVVADALVWEGADETVLAAVSHIRHFEQFLVRALIYRAVTDRLFRKEQPVRRDDDDPYLPAVDLALRLVSKT